MVEKEKNLRQRVQFAKRLHDGDACFLSLHPVLPGGFSTKTFFFPFQQPCQFQLDTVCKRNEERQRKKALDSFCVFISFDCEYERSYFMLAADCEQKEAIAMAPNERILSPFFFSFCVSCHC